MSTTTSISCDHCNHTVPAVPGGIAPHGWISVHGLGPAKHFHTPECFKRWTERYFATPTNIVTNGALNR